MATFSIGDQHFPLNVGVCLVRGIKNDVSKDKPKSGDNYLCLKHDSIEDKHALIFVESTGLGVLDLATKTGTYLAGEDGVFRCLPSMQKTTVAEFQTLRFGSLSGGTLRLCPIIDQQHSSGFHDLLDTSRASTSNNSEKRDSFNIPETQFCNISLGENEHNKTNEKNASIPETQVGHLNISCGLEDKNSTDSNQMISQFVISTQEFNATLNPAIDECSDDLLQDFDWMAENTQATTVPAKQPAQKVNESDLKPTTDCSSVEMDALNWSNTTHSKNEGSTLDRQHDDRVESVTPDLFEPDESCSKSPQSDTKSKSISTGVGKSKNNVELSSTNTVPATVSKQIDGPSRLNTHEDSAISNINKCVESTVSSESDNKNDQPLQLSNKENMEDYEHNVCDLNPTQVFVPKKANLVNCNQIMDRPTISVAPDKDKDLLPTQLFISKKDRTTQSTGISSKSPVSSDMDMEPTQLFMPKNASQHLSTSTPMRVPEQFTKTASTELNEASKTIPKTNVEFHFESAEKSNRNEEQSNNKKKATGSDEPIFDMIELPESEFLMQTPQMIADIFNPKSHTLTAAQGRNIMSNLTDESDSQETFIGLNTTSKDFDKLIESIRKGSSVLSDTDKGTTTTKDGVTKRNLKEKELPETRTKETISTSQNKRARSNDDKDPECKPSDASKLKPKNRKLKTEKTPENQSKEFNASCDITEMINAPNVEKSSRTTRRRCSVSLNQSHSTTQKVEDKQTSSNTSEKHRKKYIKEKRITQVHSNTTEAGKVITRRGSVRKRLQSESLETSNVSKSDSTSSVSTTASTRATRSRTKNADLRTTRSGSKSSECALAASKTESVLEKNDKNNGKTEHHKQSKRSAQKRKIKNEQMKEEEKNKEDQPTTSKVKKTQTPLQIAFTTVLPDKQQELLEGAKNIWTVAKNPNESKVLVMDAGARTVKFLIAMARGTPIVTSKWVEALNVSGRPSTSPELVFKDKKFEKEFKFSILRTLDKACSKRVFENLHFMLTEKILPAPKDIKEILKCAGGTVFDEVPNISTKFFLISSKEDSRLWHSFRRKNENICITSTEAVMLAIMRYDVKLLEKLSF